MGLLLLTSRTSSPGTGAPAPSAGPSSPPEPVQVSVGELCPLVTDGRTTLEVGFTLVNRASTPVAFLGVEPDLPVGGLEPAGTVLSGGTCAAPTALAPGTMARGGDPVRVLFRFRLPPTCPAPYPVLARVHVRTTQIESRTLVLLPDLGDTAFSTCPAPGAG